jgi:hypothetical protein
MQEVGGEQQMMTNAVALPEVLSFDLPIGF